MTIRAPAGQEALSERSITPSSDDVCPNESREHL